MQETLNFNNEATEARTGRTLPISPIPMAEMAIQMWNEGGWSGRLVR